MSLHTWNNQSVPVRLLNVSTDALKGHSARSMVDAMTILLTCVFNEEGDEAEDQVAVVMQSDLLERDDAGRRSEHDGSLEAVLPWISALLHLRARRLIGAA